MGLSNLSGAWASVVCALIAAIIVPVTAAILGPLNEGRKARGLAANDILVRHHEKRVEACQALFEAAGQMCSPDYDAKGEMLSREDLRSYVDGIFSLINKHGAFLDPCSRACSIYLREKSGTLLRAHPDSGVKWQDAREVWAAKSLLRSVLNHVLHVAELRASKLKKERWVLSELKISSFREDLIANLKLLDQQRGEQGSSNQGQAAAAGIKSAEEIVDGVIAEVSSYQKAAGPLQRALGRLGGLPRRDETIETKPDQLPGDSTDQAS